jgi:small subunit ribosomal protein S1
MTEEQKQPTEAEETPSDSQPEPLSEPATSPEPQPQTEQEGADTVPAPAEAPSADEMSEAYDESLRNIQEGEIVKGLVLKVEPDGVLVDIGYKSEGLIPLNEFDLDKAGEPNVRPGDTIDVYLVRREDADGLVVLSKEIADQRIIWEQIAESYEHGRPVLGRVTRRIKGGLRVEIGNMYAFLPASQVDIRPVQDLDACIGQTLEMKVIKLSRRRRNIVLSRRVLLEEEREAKRAELLSTLQVGQLREGVVKNITQFGAFIDLGGLDGLLHKTDMSWGRVNHPSEVVKRDQTVEVMVLDIDREAGKVSLGLKQLTPDPWQGIAERYPVGSDVRGRVVNVVEYGAFVELERGVEGLVHVSEMSWTRRNIDPHTVVEPGQEVTVRILGLDPNRQKISLGLKQLQENPWDTLERQHPVGSRVHGRVRNLTDFGAFVEIGAGIDGLIHVSDLSWAKRVVNPGEVLREGDEVDVVVLSIDRDRERVSLGLKQVEPDPWLRVPEKYKVGTAVQVEVVNTTAFGAFAKLEEGIEGLIHVSELSDQHVERPEDVVRVGDLLDVKVIHIDRQERRIGLSRRAYILDQDRTAVEEYSRPEAPKERAPAEPPRERPERREREERPERAERTTLGDIIEAAQREHARREENSDE